MFSAQSKCDLWRRRCHLFLSLCKMSQKTHCQHNIFAYNVTLNRTVFCPREFIFLWTNSYGLFCVFFFQTRAKNLPSLLLLIFTAVWLRFHWIHSYATMTVDATKTEFYLKFCYYLFMHTNVSRTLLMLCFISLCFEILCREIIFWSFLQLFGRIFASFVTLFHGLFCMKLCF